MKDEKEDVIYVPLKKKLAAIQTPDWSWNLNLDDLLRIDYANIFGEIITIPVLENQVGRLTAQIRNYVKEQELELSVKEAEVRYLFRNEKSADGAKKPTVQEVDDHITMDPIILGMRRRCLRLRKELEETESLYESVKSKSFKLNNLSKSIRPEDFERDLVEGVVNGLLIKIKDKRYS